MSNIQVQNPLMKCCGVVGAYGFNLGVLIDPNNPYSRARAANEKDQRERLDAVIAEQTKDMWYPRSCAMIFLDETQTTVINVAKQKGFKEIHQFYNPNSGNMVGIYTRSFATEEEWIASEEYKKIMVARRVLDEEEEDDNAL